MKRVDCLFVFHFHLPYIYHKEGNYFEENWYYQSLADSYIPFLIMMEELACASIAPSLVVSISPVLYNMMENEVMSDRFRKYLEKMLILIDEERNIINDERISKVLDVYEEKYTKVLNYFDRYSGDIITPFKLLKSQGVFEIITTPLTYPILPLITSKEAVNLQISGAIKDFQEKFLEKSRGFFIPECAWCRDIENFLVKNSIEYIFLDERSCEGFSPSNIYSLESGIRVFLRDYRAFDFLFGEKGIIKNSFYREFYRDIGYERDISYLKKYTGCDFHVPTGIKYFRITDVNVSLDKKEVYVPELAFKSLEQDSIKFADFICNIFSNSNNTPLFVAVFNTEIFGHKWFEGIDFLKHFFINVRQKRYPFNFVIPSLYIKNTLSKTIVNPSISSWSDNGFFDKWLNEKNDFVYPYLHEIIKRFIYVASRYRNLPVISDNEKILRQIVREIVMMQSSDWAVMIGNNIHKEYAIYRITKHYKNALKLIDWLVKGDFNRLELENMEKELPLFHDIEWKNFLSISII
ncbi:MAG: DUF1957 domain-containing protein [Elusimicrobiales bacterium]|nr:DUF1957 domain-containing protein [Elusimicrobiales bacterium]